MDRFVICQVTPDFLLWPASLEQLSKLSHCGLRTQVFAQLESSAKVVALLRQSFVCSVLLSF